MSGGDPRILLTGATGFLGGAVLARWLERGLPGTLVALVRADDAAQGFDRLRLSASRFLGPVDGSGLQRRCEVLPGDLESIPETGLDGITHVLHLAAHTSFRSVATARKVNVDGALALARRFAKAPALRRYVHTGTALLCGTRPPRVVHEDDYPRADLAHLVPYTETKADAELRLAELADRLPLVVARPSIVVGHTRLGCAPSGSIFWVFRAVQRLGWIPWDPAGRIDVVPVDWTADGLLHLLFSPTLRHRVYHLSAGAGFGASWIRIGEAFAAATGEEGFHRVQKTLAALDGALPGFPERFGPCDPERVRVALDLYFRFAALDVLFDNSRILSEGVAPPPAFPSFVRTCLERPPGISIAEQMHDDD